MKWTKEEIEIVKNNKSASLDALCSLLPDRTYSAVTQMRYSKRKPDIKEGVKAESTKIKNVLNLNLKKKKRQCLGCGQDFLSKSIGNRFCSKKTCQRKLDENPGFFYKTV